MTNAKIDFAVGTLTFSGEGDEKWLAAQLDKIIAAAPSLSELRETEKGGTGDSGTPDTGAKKSNVKFTEPLAGYIKAKGGETNQVKRFLAAADWLRLRGAATLTAGAVGKALSDQHQKKLANPADCLNKNITKGLCEKHGDGFYITPHGLKELGHSE